MVPATIIRQYVRKHKKCDLFFNTEPGDRPLIFQLSGNNPDLCLEAARMVEEFVDGVDLNLGCPQRIASRSGYGAFLMAFPETVERVVKTMSQGLKVGLYYAVVLVFLL
jgi:tRNA-dihydrouridine synthase 1